MEIAFTVDKSLKTVAKSRKQLLCVWPSHDELNPLGTQSRAVVQKPLRAGKILQKHESRSVCCDAANDSNLKPCGELSSQDSVEFAAFFFSTVASSCMTRLSRSRTTSLSSSYSMDGSRSRSRTLSQGSQGGQMPPSPSQTMEVSC